MWPCRWAMKRRSGVPLHRRVKVPVFWISLCVIVLSRTQPEGCGQPRPCMPVQCPTQIRNMNGPSGTGVPRLGPRVTHGNKRIGGLIGTPLVKATHFIAVPSNRLSPALPSVCLRGLGPPTIRSAGGVVYHLDVCNYCTY
jgi:hypothetical protein